MMIYEKPKCEIEGCTNDSLFFFANMYLCGDCLKTYLQSQTKLKQEGVKDACKKNPRNE